MYRGWRAAIFLAPVLAAMAILPALASNDPLFNQQWGLHKIEAERAWGPGNGGSGVVVAVVDTGVNFGHEDLAGHSAGSFKCIRAESPSQSPDCDPGGNDDHGHGTAVAGVIGASSNNGAGIASAAPSVGIMSLKVLDSKGGGYLRDVTRGIKFAANQAQNGVRVINLSLGPEVGLLSALLNAIDPSDREDRESFEDALSYAASKGVLVVAAAGNDSLQSSYTGLGSVAVVGATGPGDNRAFYSSTGEDVLAPGGDVYTNECESSPSRCIVTTGSGGGYVLKTGTSFAAPHVSGVAALLYSKGFTNPGAVRNMILDTADPVPSGRRLNAARAVDAPALSLPATTPGTTPSGAGQSQGTGDGSKTNPPARKETAAAKAKSAASQAANAAAAAPAPGGSVGVPVPGGLAGPDLSQLPVLPIGGAAGSGAEGGPDPLRASASEPNNKRGLKIVSAFTALGVLVGGGASFYRKRLG